jgi:hypothetical protein
MLPRPTMELNWLDARALRALGLNNGQIAECLGITDRHVRRLLTDWPEGGYEIDGTIRSVGRLYRVVLPAAPAAPETLGQLDFGWPVAPQGLTYRFA